MGDIVDTTTKYIKTISYDQSEIIKNILFLHSPSNRIDCDVTYGRGKFYDNTGIERPHFRFDINPINDDVHYGDCRCLPLAPRSMECIMFDPPFLATTGKSLKSSGNETNIMAKRFGVYSSEKELFQFYKDSIHELYKLLQYNGILIVKCQDKIHSCKQYMSHVYIHDMAVECGFYPKDLFILLATKRLTPKWQMEKQKHARKYHCYFWVFQKRDNKLNYI